MTQTVFGPSGSKRRRTRLLVLTTLAAALFAILFVASSSANLPSSGSFQFEDNDGNLAVNTAGNFDWNGPTPDPIDCGTHAQIPHAGTNCGTDLFKDIDPGHLDNALGQGTKEDDTGVTVVDGTIPPSKDDLTRFYVNKQKVAGHTYLYLAWERTQLLGSAHLDFEFNQANVGDLTTPGAKTLNRTPGDILIDYDFGGSGVPVLQLHRWVATGNPTAVCEIANTLPCWDKAVTLAPGTAEAQVNSSPATDTNPPDAPRTLDGNTKQGINSTFGEAGIDLTAANVFPADRCFHLGNAWVKSRSSGNSFGSELKDFVAPIPINISNCGEITIIKHSDPRGINQNFGFTSDIPAAGGPGALDEVCALDTTPASFTLNDHSGADPVPPAKGSDNTENCFNVIAGTYHVTENNPLPPGFTLEGLSCTATGTSSGSQDATDPFKANITLNAGDSVTCTYQDKQQLGAIKITKTSSKTGNALNGAQFSITKNGTPIAGSPFTTANGGVICVDNLAFGDYVVTETSPPTGFSADDTNPHTVTVDNNAKCSDDPYVGESISFTDTPLADIQVRFRDGGSGETHLAQALSCDNTTGTSSGADTAGWNNTLTVTGIKVTSSTVTVTCTIKIDP